MELAAPNVIEEDNTPPSSPYWPFILLNQNLILNVSHSPSQNLNTSLQLILTSTFDLRQRLDFALPPAANDDPTPVMPLSSYFYSSSTLQQSSFTKATSNPFLGNGYTLHLLIVQRKKMQGLLVTLSSVISKYYDKHNNNNDHKGGEG